VKPEVSSPAYWTTASGLQRYTIRVQHRGLSRAKEIRGDDLQFVTTKAVALAADWDAKWQHKLDVERQRLKRQQATRDKESKKQLAQQQTEDAERAWNELTQLLHYTLGVDDAIDWSSLQNHEEFAEPAPRSPAEPQPPARQQPPPRPADPPTPAPPALPPEPDPSQYLDRPSLADQLLDIFAPRRRAERLRALEAQFQAAVSEWRGQVRRLKSDFTALREQLFLHHQAALRAWDAESRRLETDFTAAFAQYQRHRADVLQSHRAAVAAWNTRREEFYSTRARHNALVAEYRARWLAHEQTAVEEHCDLVLRRSKYPDWYDGDWLLEYRPDSKLLVIAYQLPRIATLPRTKAVRYVQTRDELEEAFYSDRQVESAYDSVLYQIALRTFHELFESDRRCQALRSIAFNGHVRGVDPATGMDINPCIMTVQVSAEEFNQINLAQVDPKQCFRRLKGVGSAKLHTITAVAPVVRFSTEDSRFVESYEVASTLDEGENLAAMDWEDFEHLVREVFEREFSASGGEVKVTRASRDGGIDAIAFDPDPIRGGKIVIQAKRYTTTVGVSAVRDLFGTVQHEGANKGVLVTTSTYGPDAYEFAKGKPITLVDGGALLHMLSKHGHRVRIDLKEARSHAHGRGAD
jgi:restriction system protein